MAEFSYPANLLGRSPVVWLALSSFRNDREIVSILEHVHNLATPLFDRILVVDSLGTKEIPRLIARHGWQDVIYYSHDWNLGSAGNLATRLKFAAECGADFVYALNHDGHVQPMVVRCLMHHAVRLHRVGAVYPLARFSGAGAFNLTGTRELPLSAKLVYKKPQPPTHGTIDAYWSSSNGALYALEPVRAGLLPWLELWTGWEDLEYGWQLADNGYHQVIACDALFDDDYEYRAYGPPAGRFCLVNKPAWTTYYSFRNLLLIIRRTRPLFKFRAVAVFRIILECFLILFLRTDKRLRMRYLVRGIIDGLQNRTGKWCLPSDPPAIHEGRQ